MTTAHRARLSKIENARTNGPSRIRVMSADSLGTRFPEGEAARCAGWGPSGAWELIHRADGESEAAFNARAEGCFA